MGQRWVKHHKIPYCFECAFSWLSLDGKASAYNVGDPGSIPGSGRSPGEGNGNPLQYSCLENPMGRGAWWAKSMWSQRVRHNWATSLHFTSSLSWLSIYLLGYCIIDFQSFHKILSSNVWLCYFFLWRNRNLELPSFLLWHDPLHRKP